MHASVKFTNSSIALTWWQIQISTQMHNSLLFFTSFLDRCQWFGITPWWINIFQAAELATITNIKDQCIATALKVRLNNGQVASIAISFHRKLLYLRDSYASINCWNNPQWYEWTSSCTFFYRFTYQHIVCNVIIERNRWTKRANNIKIISKLYWHRESRKRRLVCSRAKSTNLLVLYACETPETLSALVERIRFQVSEPRRLPRPPISGRRRQCLLDVRNRVLLVMIWLRQYLKLHVLANIFGISKSTVAEEIYHIVPILYNSYQHYISWPNMRKWNTLLNEWPNFPSIVGMIDATVHRIRRPSGPMQVEFYRGDKKFHFMTTQIVVDNDGLIVLLVTG